MTYTTLLAQVVDTLGQQVTTAQVDAMLPFVEARFNRTINSPQREVEAYANPTSDVTLPQDCWQVRDMWLVGSPDATLEQLSPDAARSLFGGVSGSPEAYTITGTKIDFWPTPSVSSTDTIKIRYQQTIPALTTTNTTNWLLTQHPDIYYYSLLLQCEAYIVNDERLPLWKAGLDEALGELKD
ncbi:MAG TPA: hypothetical protein VI199_03645 [Novosphingobium sp.]